MNTRISIDNLIEIVGTGGKVKTGVDVYNENGILLLDKDILLDKVKILEIIKESGINSVPVNSALDGGLWDGNGNLISVSTDGLIDFGEPGTRKIAEPVIQVPDNDSIFPNIARNEIEIRLLEIEEIKKQAAQKYSMAKKSIKRVLSDIRSTGGQFDVHEVEVNVSKLVDFLAISDNPFSYLTQEIFSYDDYLYNHSVNVCAIGISIVNRFNAHYSDQLENSPGSFKNNTENLNDIALGFFLHDIGKVLVSETILNKEGRLTVDEFEEVKKHSYKYGRRLLKKNELDNSVIKNIVNYHHAPLYEEEQRCYPAMDDYTEVPFYTRICKLADIYDAMTSKRCYNEAINPISVVTQLFRAYAKKDDSLQYILHAFVKSIGIYPPGSVVYLKNGQMAYVLETQGPLVIQFTDEQENTLRNKPDPVDISSIENDDITIDNERSLKTPMDVYDILPTYIKNITIRP